MLPDVRHGDRRGRDQHQQNAPAAAATERGARHVAGKQVCQGDLDVDVSVGRDQAHEQADEEECGVADCDVLADVRKDRPRMIAAFAGHRSELLLREVRIAHRREAGEPAVRDRKVDCHVRRGRDVALPVIDVEVVALTRRGDDTLVATPHEDRSPHRDFPLPIVVIRMRQ